MAAGKIQETKDFIEESWVELKRVTWPDQDQLKNATIVVLVFVIIISTMIWGMDIIVRFLINSIMGFFGA